MNQAQVLDAYRLDRLRREREAEASRRSAQEWVARHPELCDDNGNPCGYAVEVALHYHRLGGPFDVALVRRHRDMKVAGIIERLSA